MGTDPGQVAWYQAMEACGEMIQINDLASLEKHLALWSDTTIPNEQKAIGYILSLEAPILS
jgi:membrane dipeptidase